MFEIQSAELNYYSLFQLEYKLRIFFLQNGKIVSQSRVKDSFSSLERKFVWLVRKIHR